MTIAQINEETTSRWGFHVFSWNQNNGIGPYAGRHIIGKHDFSGLRSRYEAEEGHITLEDRNLEGLSVVQFAEVCNKVFETYENFTTEDGTRFTPRSIHIEAVDGNFITNNVFFFVLGDREEG